MLDIHFGVNIDNKKYLDFTMLGIGTSVLGYADPTINLVAKKSMNASPMNTLNAPEDVELAELLLKIHPWAQSEAVDAPQLCYLALWVAAAAVACGGDVDASMACAGAALPGVHG